MPAHQVHEATAPERRRDPGRTQNEILEVATREFAERGLSGARVDEIAARTRTTKRMIYYYFQGKEGLFVAVLQRAYSEIRALEQTVRVDDLDPTSAIRRVAELTFDHHEAHPDFIKLVTIENIHCAQHMTKVDGFAELNSPAIGVLEDILERGYAEGAFRRRVDAVDLHMMISAFCVFRVGNRHTFGRIFGRDMMDPALRGHYRRILGDMVVDHLTAEGAEPMETSAGTERADADAMSRTSKS
jgi:AcrR family transcriptional regulator